MAENKKGFILYCDLIHTIEQLPNDKAGELFKHILRYVNDLDPITDDLVTKITFEPIKQQLKRDLNKWKEKSIKRSEAGRLGGLKSGEVRKQNEANEAIASNSKQNEQVIVKDTVTVTDNVIDKVKEKQKRNIFIIPNLNDIKEYCLERNNKINPEHFLDYYTANGWMIGKNKMKDWKATIRTWEKNNINYNSNTSNNANNRRDLSQIDHGTATKLADM